MLATTPAKRRWGPSRAVRRAGEAFAEKASARANSVGGAVRSKRGASSSGHSHIGLPHSATLDRRASSAPNPSPGSLADVASSKPTAQGPWLAEREALAMLHGGIGDATSSRKQARPKPRGGWGGCASRMCHRAAGGRAGAVTALRECVSNASQKPRASIFAQASRAGHRERASRPRPARLPAATPRFFSQSRPVEMLAARFSSAMRMAVASAQPAAAARAMSTAGGALSGTVQWFNPKKGYGFIVPDESNSTQGEPGMHCVRRDRQGTVTAPVEPVRAPLRLQLSMRRGCFAHKSPRPATSFPHARFRRPSLCPTSPPQCSCTTPPSRAPASVSLTRARR